MICFDIETAPLSTEECLPFMPEFEPPGNYKDPVKIAENIAEQKAKWLDKAALSPLTGSILAIGYKEFGSTEVHVAHGLDEKAVLSQFLDDCGDVSVAPMVGWNIIGFDMPFILKRAWKHGLKVPAIWRGSKPWEKDRVIIDLMIEWQCGDRKAPMTGLDTAARYLGLPGKTGDFGKMFADLYAADQATALEYLERDIEMVEAIYGKVFA